MIKIKGTITNRLKTGRYGEFSVGTFKTDIGVFTIKSQLLDQYPEGEYNAEVVARYFELDSYCSRSNGVTIARILLDPERVNILDFDIKPVDSDSVEPDASLSEDKQEQPAKIEGVKPAKKIIRRKAKSSSMTEVKQSDNQSASDIESESDPATLFGSQWPLAESFKLDKTLPRNTIIKQVNYIKDSYEMLDPRTQVWSRKKA